MRGGGFIRGFWRGMRIVLQCDVEAATGVVRVLFEALNVSAGCGEGAGM